MEKKQYHRKCSEQFEKWAAAHSPFFTSKEQSGLRVSADKERTQGALLRRGVFSYSPNSRIYDRMSVSELEQAVLVPSERRMAITIAAKQRRAPGARIVIE